MNPETHHISILDLTLQTMSTPSYVAPGTYHIQLSLLTIQPVPGPKPYYLTSNGEGNQLTLEHPTGHANQEVN